VTCYATFFCSDCLFCIHHLTVCLLFFCFTVCSLSYCFAHVLSLMEAGISVHAVDHTISYSLVFQLSLYD
jgi:hypothetical protein